MSDALLPCPFCGGGACLGADMNAFPHIACDACGASVSGRGVDGAFAAWNARADIHEAEVARLREVENAQIRRQAQHWLRRTMSAPGDAEVEALCEKHGYGAVMDAASRLWARKPGGSAAFYVGGCIGFWCDEEARAALAEIEATPTPEPNDE